MIANDTIAAVATPPGRGGIGVLRLSGPGAKAIALTVLHVQEMAPYRVHYTQIVDAQGAVLDECVATYFAGPRSYTGEDVVEISAHGSPVLLEWLLRAVTERGARLARAGEFTERAFLSGRLDLTQAEAVRDLIDATTLEQARAASRQLGGALAKTVAPIKTRLIALIGALEAGVDFAEDDVDVMTSADLQQRLHDSRAALDALAATYAYGRVLRQGITLAIAGRPNAGKSSLFNRLIRRDRAIVTATPGTTRDLVTETFSLDGIPVHLVDTAGLREAGDEAEAIGIAKSREAQADADLVLLVLDGSADGFSDEEARILADEWLQTRLVVAVNKSDLARRLALSAEIFGATPTAHVSALTGAGIDDLRALLKAKFVGSSGAEDAILTNARQQQSVRDAAFAVAAAQTATAQNLPHEVLLIDLYSALRALDELTGQTTPDDILALIFSTFCIGK